MSDEPYVTTKAAQSYQEFMTTRKDLISIVDEVIRASEKLELSQETTRNIHRVRSITVNGAFRVIVVGSFSRGKSTMINAVLGDDLLPAKLAPATAVITIIRYGERPQALIRYKDDEDHVVEMPVDKLRDYLLIPREKLSGSSGMVNIGSPYERVEIQFPCDICKDGVEIVDSPGLEEDEVRQRITTEFLNQSDAAIVLLSCQQLITRSEERFIRDELKRRGFDHIFYVINFCDELTDEEDFDDIRHRAHTKLGSDERIFMVSSRDALRAKQSRNQLRLEQSGFPAFEKALESFLVAHKGKVKVSTSHKLIGAAIEQLIESTGIKRGLLEHGSVEELNKLQAEFNRRSEEVLSKKEDVLVRIGERGAFLGERLCSSYARKCRELSWSLVSVAEEMEVEGSLFQAKKYQENVVQELKDYIEDQFNEWVQTDALQIYESEIERIRQGADHDLKGILDDIDDLKLMLILNMRLTYKQAITPLSELPTVGSLVFGDIGGAITGGALGARAALTQVGLTMAIQSVLCMVGLLNPITDC